MNSLCLLIDGLHQRYLGCYGNTSIGTGAFDRLAAESLVLDQLNADAVSLAGVYRSWWSGTHALVPEERVPAERALPELLAQQGTHTVLITDEPLVAELPLAGAFEELVRIDLPWATCCAEQVEETGLMRFFAAALEALRELPQPFFAWLHCRGMQAPWDAPLGLRQRFADEEDPDPPRWVEVPQRELAADYDPDELLQVRQAYAGQITLLDACLDGLMEELRHTGRVGDTLLAVLSARGMPLGEHRRVGFAEGLLHAEQTGLAGLLRFPEGEGSCDRTPALLQPGDVGATLMEAVLEKLPGGCWGKSLLPLIRLEEAATRDRLLSAAGSWRALRTPAWRMLWDVERPQDSARLYALPDDRWEMNDVSQRCADVVEQMLSVGEAYEAALEVGEFGVQTPLEPVLIEGLD